MHGQEVEHKEGGKTVPGGALASAASNYCQGQCLYFVRRPPRRGHGGSFEQSSQLKKKEKNRKKENQVIMFRNRFLHGNVLFAWV